ncbi:DMT family transporter [Hoeflea sp. TYP-13]|uniref:DMT family transporter n=1 Tax=Hoeflea sp. TYP-13 TaxID=3230023 RepID=UPI0034C5ED9D
MSVVENTRAEGALAGIAWMVATSVCFVAVTGIVRYIGTDIPAVEAAFIRYAFGVLMFVPMLGPIIKKPPSLASMRIYALRGLVHGIAVILWFFAMARIPIAEVTALGYTAPIFVTIGAAIFFREKLHFRRVAAVVVGFAGTMVILRPGFHEIASGQIAQLAAAPLFAASFLFAKRLTQDEDPVVIVIMLSIFCTLVLLPGAVLNWSNPSLGEIFWLAVTAIVATIGHYTMTRALRAAPLTVTQPVSFLQLVWATALGIVIFGEPMDPFVLIGGGIVVAAITFISHREAVAARRPITPPAPATKD